MWLHTPSDSRRIGRPHRRSAARPLVFEALEDRTVPAYLTVSDVRIVEGNTGTQNARVTVSLSAPTDQTVKVNYGTADLSAVAGSDYLAVSGTLSFVPGQTSKTVQVPVIGDRLAEYPEEFYLNLSGAKHATIIDGQGVVTIVDDEPRISISDASVVEGNSGTSPLTFTVTLSAASPAPVTVKYATSNNSAVAASDYKATSGTLTFAAGETVKTITVQVNGDRLGELDETFDVTLSGPTNALISDGRGEATIIDDEPRLSITDASAIEGNAGSTDLTFNLTLSAASDVPVTVNYATADGTAAAGSDYQAAAGTLTFAPGETSKTITVLATGDRRGEGDESFFVNLSAPTNSFVTDGKGVGSIVDDEPHLSINSVSGLEGNDGATEFLFTVTLSAASEVPVTVDYGTADNSATAPSDYQAADGTLTFSPGETSKTISVLVNGDTDAEVHEYFSVILANPTGASLGTGLGWGTILIDDPLPPAVWIDSAEGWEDPYGLGPGCTFNVWLTAPSDDTVTLDFCTGDGTALAGSDYLATSGTLTFFPGQMYQSISVGIIGDLEPEPPETFYIYLVNLNGNAFIASGMGVGTIWNYDASNPNGD